MTLAIILARLAVKTPWREVIMALLLFIFMICLQDDLLKLNEKFINRRLETHASRINLMQYPAYQEIANLYVQRHLFLYRSTENHLKSMQGAHSSFYCDYLRSINVSAVCDNDVTSNLPEVIVSACQFEKISPRHYLRYVFIFSSASAKGVGSTVTR